MAHFNLVTIDGDALGAVRLARSDWTPGSIIYRGGNEPNLRVLELLRDGEPDPEKFVILVVEEAP